MVSHLCTPPYDKTTGEKFIEEEQKGALWSNVHIYMIDARNCYVNPLFRFKGAGSFHLHRKTVKELGTLAVLGVREQPNLAQNLVTHRH